MIKKSLLLLALMCGSAIAVAPLNTSKNATNDFATVEKHVKTNVSRRVPRRIYPFSLNFTFVDDYGVTQPLQQVKVEMHARQGVNDFVVTSGYTNEDGSIFFNDSFDTIDIYEQGTVLYFKLLAEGPATRVVDASNVPYAWESDMIEDHVQGSHTFIEETFEMSSEVGKALSISQASIVASEFAKFMNYNEDITMCTIHYPNSDGTYYNRYDNIYIAGSSISGSTLQSRPNSYADFDMICHEYGHHVQKVFRIEQNPGGTHYSRHNAEDDFHDQKLSDGSNKYTESNARYYGIRLAYAEGWATAFSLLAQQYSKDNFIGNKFFADSRYTAYNGVDVGYGNYEVCKGEGAEESVTAFIWNLFDEDNGNDPVENFCYPLELFETFSHDAFTFDDFLTNFDEGDPDRTYLGQLLSKLKMSPSRIETVGTLYTNRAPTFTWDVGGGSKYYPNNEFYVYFEAHVGFNYTTRYYHTTVTGTPETVTFTMPLEDWQAFINSGAETFTVYVSASCNRFADNTGGYITPEFTFDIPTQAKVGPDPVTMTPADWGFEQQYFNVVKTKIFDLEEVDLVTERLRTGRIESNQIVMSAKKKGAGKAYFRVTSDVPFESVSYDISLWSASEGINANNSTIILETMNAVGDWTVDTNFWSDVTLPTDRNNMITLTTNNSSAIYGIKFTVTAPSTGSSNNGRVALRNITFNF